MPSVDRSVLSFGQTSTYATEFVSALLEPARSTPPLICAPNGKAATRRYNIYRNNVTVSLINALAATFPATLRITGEAFFRAMARAHVRANPPTSPLLFEYGRDFPAFIERYEYAQSMPWLVDVARIERAWLDSYHSDDVPPLPPQALASIRSDELGGIVLVPHPATRIVFSRYPAVSVFVANRSHDPVGRIEATGAEAALVTRPVLDVAVHILPPGGFAFLDCLIKGETLGTAVAVAMGECPEFDLSVSIAGMLQAGAFTAIERGV